MNDLIVALLNVALELLNGVIRVITVLDELARIYALPTPLVVVYLVSDVFKLQVLYKFLIYLILVLYLDKA